MKQYCICGYTIDTHMCICAQLLSHVKLFVIPRTVACQSMDCPWTVSFVHGIIPAGILKWAAISDFRESSWPRDHYCISCIGRWILYHWTTWTHTHKTSTDRKCTKFMIAVVLRLGRRRRLGFGIYIWKGFPVHLKYLFYLKMLEPGRKPCRMSVQHYTGDSSQGS